MRYKVYIEQQDNSKPLLILLAPASMTMEQLSAWVPRNARVRVTIEKE